MDACVPRRTGFVRPRMAHYILFLLYPKHIRPAVLHRQSLPMLSLWHEALRAFAISSHVRWRMKSELSGCLQHPVMGQYVLARRSWRKAGQRQAWLAVGRQPLDSE